jgi:hypothetical protein
MILATHGFLASSIGQFDADAVAFFNRVTTAGGTLSATEQNAINTLVSQMKTDGIWTKMKAIYPMVGASAAACAQNLKSSSFTGVFNGSWNFTSLGVTSNTPNTFMNTGLNPFLELSVSSAHMSSYNNTTPSGGVMISNGNLSSFLQYSVGQLYGGMANNSFINAVASQTASFIMVNRPSSTTLKIIRNSTIVLSNTANTGSLYVSSNLEIGRYGNAFYESSRFAFCSIGEGFTDNEAVNFYTAIQAFQTTLSRQV